MIMLTLHAVDLTAPQPFSGVQLPARRRGSRSSSPTEFAKDDSTIQ